MTDDDEEEEEEKEEEEEDDNEEEEEDSFLTVVGVAFMVVTAEVAAEVARGAFIAVIGAVCCAANVEDTPDD